MAPVGDILAYFSGKGKGENAADTPPSPEEVEELIRQLLADAERECAEIRAQAEVECQTVAERYGKEAEEVYWARATAGRRAADQKTACMVNIATMEARKHILTLRQVLVGQAFDTAIQRILDLPEEQYVDLLASFTVQAVRTGREQLIFSPRDRRDYGKRVTIQANEALSAAGREAGLTMSEETREILGGVIVTGGQVDTNCSLEALVAARRRELTAAVAETLFE